MLNDLRISLRGLLRAPLMTLTIVVDRRPRHRRDNRDLRAPSTRRCSGRCRTPIPDRLVRIYTDAPPNKFRFSVADYQALEAQQTRFEQVAGYTEPRDGASATATIAERLRATAGVLDLFRDCSASRRRSAATSRRADGRPGSPPAVIVSHGFWQQRLGGRAGRDRPDRFDFDGADYTLVGVLPRAVGPLEQRQRVLRRRAVADAAAQGSVLHHRPRPSAGRRAARAGRERRAARDQPAAVSDVEGVVSGRARRRGA